MLIFLYVGFQSTDKLSFFSVKKKKNLLRAMSKTIFDVFALSNAGSEVVLHPLVLGKNEIVAKSQLVLIPSKLN